MRLFANIAIEDCDTCCKCDEYVYYCECSKSCYYINIDNDVLPFCKECNSFIRECECDICVVSEVFRDSCSCDFCTISNRIKFESQYFSDEMYGGFTTICRYCEYDIGPCQGCPNGLTCMEQEL